MDSKRGSKGSKEGGGKWPAMADAIAAFILPSMEGLRVGSTETIRGLSGRLAPVRSFLPSINKDGMELELVGGGKRCVESGWEGVLIWRCVRMGVEDKLKACVEDVLKREYWRVYWICITCRVETLPRALLLLYPLHQLTTGRYHGDETMAVPVYQRVSKGDQTGWLQGGLEGAVGGWIEGG